jgi:cytoskeleton protein RodZ
MTDFGASFKRSREALGVSLNQIAIETRISTRFLLAIENEDFRLLPGGIFNRGFIRAYAERVGLDPDRAVADYERLAQAMDPEALLQAEAASTKTARRLYPIAVGALILLIVLFYFVTRPSASSITASPSPVENTAPVTPTPAVTAPEPPPPDPPAQTPQTPAADPAPVPAAAAPVPQALALEIEIHQPTWIKLSTDGASMLNEILQPGTTRRFTAQTSIDITVGNAGGLTLKVNDQQVRSLGRQGQVRSLRITPENIADIIG